MTMVWGTVTDISPLRVTLDGDTSELPFTPDSLVDPLVFAVNDRVRCDLSGRRLVIVGRSGGSPVPAASTSIPGVVELATNAETITGTDAGRAVTPAGLAAVRALPVLGQSPSSVVVGSGSATVAADGTVTFTAASSVSLNDVFDAARGVPFGIHFECVTSTSAAVGLRLRASGTTTSTSYRWQYVQGLGSVVSGGSNAGAADWLVIGSLGNAATVVGDISLLNPSQAVVTAGTGQVSAHNNANGTMVLVDWAYYHNASTAFDGLTLFASAGTLTGTIKVVKLA